MRWRWVEDCQCWLAEPSKGLVWQDVLTLKWHGIWKTTAGTLMSITPRPNATEAMGAIPLRPARRYPARVERQVTAHPG